ncbi:MerR family transcriptional regulator [Rhodococcus sp. NPDC054953]
MLIGEVSRLTGLSARVLRHYDALGLVTPTGRTAGGYREYSADDIRRLFHVESLRTLGLSLTNTRRALDEPGFAPADLVGELIRHTRQRIAAEQELLTRLERVDAAAPAQWGDVLHLVALLRALESESGGRRQQAVLSHEAPVPARALAEAALTEEDANVAGALRWSLARADGRGLAELAVGLDADAAEVRRRAVEAIASVPAAEATALLRRAIGDADGAVRGRAALELGARGGVDAIPVLLGMVVAGGRDVEAAEVLGRLAEVAGVGDEIVGALQGDVDSSADGPTRLRITQALAETPGTTAHQALLRLTGDADRTVAATAAAIVHLREQAGPV